MAEDAVDAALAADDAGAVAWFVELVKSRALAATISVPRDPAADPHGSEAEFDTLSQQIDALAFAQYSGSGSAGVLQRAARSDRPTGAVLERIRIGDPRWRAMTEPPGRPRTRSRRRSGRPGSARPAPPQARPDRAGHRGAGRSRPASSPSHASLEPETTAAITKFVENLRKPHRTTSSSISARRKASESSSYSPKKSSIGSDDAETCLVVPHGILHLLPWACLTVGAERLFERCAVGVLPEPGVPAPAGLGAESSTRGSRSSARRTTAA